MNLLEKLQKRGVVKEGDFTLKGGQESPFYFDIKLAYGDPTLLKEFVHRLARLVPDETTCIAGSGHGGIPIASILSFMLDKRLTLVRDVPKDHGTKKVIDAYVPNASDRVVIVDDVLTSGTSIQNTVANLGDVIIEKYLIILRRGDAKDPKTLIESLIDVRSE